MEDSLELLFASRTLPAQKGYVELKPIDKTKFEGKEVVGFYGQVTPNGQFVKKFTKKGYKILKLNTDELGNTYIENGEKEPSDILDM